MSDDIVAWSAWDAHGGAMSDEAEVTEYGEIVARCIKGDAWTESTPEGIWLTTEEGDERSRTLASALLSREGMAAWCRRVLIEVEGGRHAAGDELMRVLGFLVGDPGRSAADDAWMRRTLDILRRRPETDPAWEPVPVDADLRTVDPDPVPTVDEADAIRELAELVDEAGLAMTVRPFPTGSGSEFLGEAAIRADERAKVQAEAIDALHSRLDGYLLDVNASTYPHLQDRARAKCEAFVEALTLLEGIRAGKHRSTP